MKDYKIIIYINLLLRQKFQPSLQMVKQQSSLPTEFEMLQASVIMGASGCKMFCHIPIHLTSFLAGLYSWGMLGDNSHPSTSPTNSNQKSAADNCHDRLINLKIRLAVSLPAKPDTITSLRRQQRKSTCDSFIKKIKKKNLFQINVLCSYIDTSIHRYGNKNESKYLTHKSGLLNGFKSAKYEIYILKTERNQNPILRMRLTPDVFLFNMDRNT